MFSSYATAHVDAQLTDRHSYTIRLTHLHTHCALVNTYTRRKQRGHTYSPVNIHKDIALFPPPSYKMYAHHRKDGKQISGVVRAGKGGTYKLFCPPRKLAKECTY